jgi:hypothetical protein
MPNRQSMIMGIILGLTLPKLYRLADVVCNIMVVF